MAASPQLLADIVIPENFTPYMQQMTEEKARLIQSGVIERTPMLDDFLAGGGLTINVPSFHDLDSDVDRVATSLSSSSANHYSLGNTTLPGTGTITRDPVPRKIERSQEVAVRLSRNNSWTSVDLAASLAGVDPMDAIASRISHYWARRLQAAFIATWQGVIADNAAAPSPTGSHVQNDLVNDVSGTSYSEGVTTFSAEAFLDAALTMGDSQDDLTAVMVHSVVYNRMQKNNLIDFIPDARGEVQIPTFRGREVIKDDSMPNTSNVYDTWLFGGSSTMLGMGSPKMPMEVQRLPGSQNGAGQEVMYSRVEWSIHPVGHAFIGTGANNANNAGPANTVLDDAASWQRVYPERKQIKFARLVTREA